MLETNSNLRQESNLHLTVNKNLCKLYLILVLDIIMSVNGWLVG